MRQFNERVVLQAIRLNGSLAKAEIAREKHLTFAELRFADPDTLFAEIEQRLAALISALPTALRTRLHGIGVAAPLSLGGWQSVLGIAASQAAEWAQIDIRERVGAMTDLPVRFVKETAAACVAELVAGRGRSIRSFLYVFVDTSIGGGSSSTASCAAA